MNELIMFIGLCIFIPLIWFVLFTPVWLAAILKVIMEEIKWSNLGTLMKKPRER